MPRLVAVDVEVLERVWMLLVSIADVGEEVVDALADEANVLLPAINAALAGPSIEVVDE
mgnify:CR=1 FL=1